MLINRTRANGHKLKAHEIKFEQKRCFYFNGGQRLEKVVQGGCQVCIFGDISSQTGQGSEQPALSEPD